MFKHESGILLHPTCLPGPYGIGDLGSHARRWIGVLRETRQALWQVLPLTPTHASPYQSRSSFAGNPLLISLDDLSQWGLLSDAELASAQLPHGQVDFAQVLEHKLPLLRRAAQRFLSRAAGADAEAFGHFKAQQRYWLDDFARYQALKSAHHQASWLDWPMDVRRRDKDTLRRVDRQMAEELELERAIQFFFEKQWHALKTLAHQNGIRVVGDIPIFVALDSADVWAAQHLFKLDPNGNPTKVAGVPPDYFSREGQRWGNPLYDWSAHISSRFDWWCQRVQRTFEMTTLARIDHFRGFAACWEIPADEPTAVHGEWVPAPGRALFERLQEVFGRDLPILAEDLGTITDDVVELRDHFGFPTMRVLQFSFGGEVELLPHHFPKNCVAYTGTHDNDTTVGWYAGPVGDNSTLDPAAAESERHRVREYFRTDGSNIHWTCIRALMAGSTDAVIFPWQDVLGLDSSARMNTPGTVGPHNWSWRFSWDQVPQSALETLRGITEATGRNAPA